MGAETHVLSGYLNRQLVAARTHMETTALRNSGTSHKIFHERLGRPSANVEDATENAIAGDGFDFLPSSASALLLRPWRLGY